MHGIYIYANIGGILMVNVTIYGIHTDPTGMDLILILVDSDVVMLKSNSQKNADIICAEIR